jgi:hypothetical protein
MTHPMGPVESQIGKRDGQRYLNPVREASDRGLNGHRHDRCGSKNAQRDDGEKAKLCQDAVQEQEEDEVVRKARRKIFCSECKANRRSSGTKTRQMIRIIFKPSGSISATSKRQAYQSRWISTTVRINGWLTVGSRWTQGAGALVTAKRPLLRE